MKAPSLVILFGVVAAVIIGLNAWNYFFQGDGSWMPSVIALLVLSAAVAAARRRRATP